MQFTKCIENELQNAPQGTLRISKSGKTIQYYQITKSGDTHGRYIPAKSYTLAKLNKLRRPLIHPDFICLNIRTRQEFIWEHFGKMDDAEYTSSAAQKLKVYEKNGIYPGKNLIISLETSTLPINSMQVEKTAKQYLL